MHIIMIFMFYLALAHEKTPGEDEKRAKKRQELIVNGGELSYKGASLATPVAAAQQSAQPGEL